MSPELQLDQRLSNSEIVQLKNAGMSGIAKIGGFEAKFDSFETGDRVTVNLTSAAVWLVVIGDDQDYVYFVEQSDRTLENGKHPWEVPSGKVNSSDIDIFHTAQRELFEETGIRNTKLHPIAVALKRNQQNIPFVSIVQSFRNDIWIHDEEMMFNMAKQQELNGGLVFVSTIPISEVPGLSMIRGLPFDDEDMFGGRKFRPPPEVDPNEISSFTLDPLDIVMSGQSAIIPQTGHMWAQADAFRAFTLKANSA